VVVAKKETTTTEYDIDRLAYAIAMSETKNCTI
jgi:hypothetical protein